MTMPTTGAKISCRAISLLSCLLLLAACAAPGPDNSVVFEQGDCASCRVAFPEGGWQFVHEIVFHFRGGEGRFLGIVALDGERLRCALTTLEGLTVFSAQASRQPGGPVEVERALPPLDKAGFAAGLLADLRLLFTAPTGSPSDSPNGLPSCGWRHGERLCRWRDADMVVDVLISQAGCWMLEAFRDGRLVRTARASSCVSRDGYALPGSIILQAAGDADYQVTMRLISADKTGK